MKNIIFLVFACFFVETNILCNKPIESIASPAEEEYVTYIIEDGQQFCIPNPRVATTDSQLNFEAIFDSSCMYATSDPLNQNDINKLYGFSDCNTHHLENSARIGWRWSMDSLRIFAFVHNNGNIVSAEITTALIGESISCSIACVDGHYQFTANDRNTTLARSCQGQYNRYKLYPYFGGDETAPHTISISIREL